MFCKLKDESSASLMGYLVPRFKLFDVSLTADCTSAVEYNKWVFISSQLEGRTLVYETV